MLSSSFLEAVLPCLLLMLVLCFLSVVEPLLLVLQLRTVQAFGAMGEMVPDAQHEPRPVGVS